MGKFNKKGGGGAGIKGKRKKQSKAQRKEAKLNVLQQKPDGINKKPNPFDLVFATRQKVPIILVVNAKKIYFFRVRIRQQLWEKCPTKGHFKLLQNQIPQISERRHWMLSFSAGEKPIR
jgi:hypothetical protein